MDDQLQAKATVEEVICALNKAILSARKLDVEIYFRISDGYINESDFIGQAPVIKATYSVAL